MGLVIRLLTVLGLGVIELWAAIPAGLALKLHPLVTGAVAAIGAILGMLIVLMLGGRLRIWLVRRHSARSEDKPRGCIYRIWDRYGVVGLGLLAPLLIGTPVGTALGVALGVPRGRLLFWMSIGILLSSAVLTLVGALGFAGIENLMH